MALKRVSKKITSILDGLKKQVAEFGLTKAQKDIADLKTAGAGDADIAKATALEKQLETLEAQKSITEQLNKWPRTTQSLAKMMPKTFDALQALHASATQIAEAQTLGKQHEYLEQHKKDIEEAKKISEDSVTPLQKQAEEIERINRLHQLGLLTDQQSLDALDKLGRENQKGRANEERRGRGETL